MKEALAETTLVREASLRAQLERMLGALGVPADQAVTVADNLVEADLRGVDSHGAHLMALYNTRVTKGHIRPVTEVTVTEDRGSTVLLDGHLGFGQVAGVAAMDLAVERAREHGVATVAIRELTHLGALAYYTMRAAAAGFLALAFQNGATIVPPFGGTTSLFSTNPFSYAVPTGEHPTIVYDIATTAAHLHGAMGVSNEMPFMGMVTSAMVMGIADGPTEVHKVTVARQVLRDYRPSDDLWPTEHRPRKLAAAREKYADHLEHEVGNL